MRSRSCRLGKLVGVRNSKQCEQLACHFRAEMNTAGEQSLGVYWLEQTDKGCDS